MNIDVCKTGNADIKSIYKDININIVYVKQAMQIQSR